MYMYIIVPETYVTYSNLPLKTLPGCHLLPALVVYLGGTGRDQHPHCFHQPPPECIKNIRQRNKYCIQIFMYNYLCTCQNPQNTTLQIRMVHLQPLFSYSHLPILTACLVLSVPLTGFMAFQFRLVFEINITN